MKGTLRLGAAFCLLFGGAAGGAELADVRQLAAQGRLEEALTAVDGALAAEPGSAEARLLRGFVLARAGREDEALEVFLELTRSHPQYPEPFNNLAVIYAGRGDYERAVEILKQALQTHSSYRTAYENLTKVYGQLASRAYDRALGQESSAPVPGPALYLLSDLDPDGSGERGAAATVVFLEPLAPAPVEVAASGAREPAIAAAPEPRPAEQAAPAAPPATPPEDVFDASELVEVVRRWAAAWSDQRVADYLDFYSSRFAPGGGASRSAWAEQRRERLRRPRFIEVAVDSVGVRPLAAGRAQVKFVQSYRSDTLQDRVIKTLDMVREGGEWKIAREESRPE